MKNKMPKNKKTGGDPETLEFAVYGGICGILGLLSIALLFIAVLECKPEILNVIGRSIISISLGLLSIHLGRKSKTKQGTLVILLGIGVLILVGLLYIFGIIPCAMG